MKRFQLIITFAMALALGVTGSATDLKAQTGAVVPPEALPIEARSALAADISSARKSQPSVFARLVEVRDKVAAMDANKRGRFAPVAMSLKNIGPDVILPALEALAFADIGRRQWTESAWIAWRAGLIEAAGAGRDPRGESVYKAILASGDHEFYVNRAAAEALGKLNSDRAADTLLQLATTPNPKQLAVIHGMGACRRLVVVQTLGTLLDSSPATNEPLNTALIEALGDAGNAWAWETPAVGDVPSEEQQLRTLAAKHLVAAYTRLTGSQQKAALKAVLLVNHPSTLSWIDQARTNANRSVTKALDRLQSRFESNPLSR